MERLIDVVAAVIIDDDHKVLCAQRGSEDRHPYKWEFPGGKVEPGETPQNALKRELMEELSITSKINDKITEIRFSYDTYDINLTLFDVSITEGELNLNVHHSVQWTPIDEMETLEWLPVDYPLLPKVKNYFMNTINHTI